MLEIETNNISFDTSFIESQNFLHGSKLKELTRLAHNGTIKLFITDITYREILARFKKNLQTADEKIKKPQRDIEINSRVLRNFKNFEPLFNFPIINIEELLKEFETLFKTWLNDSSVKVIPTDELKITDVFNDYFNNNPPFQSQQKKHEFPDAFTLKALEKHFVDEKAYLLTNDKDLLEYKSENLIAINDAAILINLIIRDYSEKRQKQTIKLIDEQFELERDTIEKEITDAIEFYIKDEIDGMIEYDSIKIEATNYVELTYFKLNSYSIINLDTTNAELECDISFSFSASFSGTDINDEWFDRDNHYWHLPENQDYTIEDTYDSTATIYAKVDLETERIIFSVGLINNGKDLNIFESFKN